MSTRIQLSIWNSSQEKIAKIEFFLRVKFRRKINKNESKKY
jgi:hypothetical protein